MIIIIAALAENRVIGKDNKLLWDIPEDMKHFRETTSGATIVMGRKTFDSIGRPLPNRNNIVISRKMTEQDGIDVCRSVEEALEKAKTYGKDIYVIGGAEIYRQSMEFADKLILSHVKGEYDGDVFFPDFTGWKEVKRKKFDEFDLVEYEKC